jgi:hypothetical protein
MYGQRQRHRGDVLLYTLLTMTVVIAVAVASILHNHPRMVSNQCLSQNLDGEVPEPRYEPNPTQEDSGGRREELSSRAGGRFCEIVVVEWSV